MFKWMKDLFITAEDVAVPVTQNLSEIAPKPLTIKKEVEKVETAVSKKVVKKVEKVVEVELSTVKVTKAGLSKLTKQGLEDFAKATYGVDIDRRKKKEELVKEVLKLSKKA